MYQHKNEYRFYGAQRSGNHAIINWSIANMADGEIPTCFMNDVTPSNMDPTKCDGLPCMKKAFRTALVNRPINLVVSFEEFGAKSRAHEFKSLVEPVVCYVKRDPRDIAASRIARLEYINRTNGGRGWGSELMDQSECGRFKLFDLLDSFQPETDITARYEKWRDDRGYRDELAERMGFTNKDRGLKGVPRYGFGSSFNEPPKVGQSRWPEYVGHSLMDQFLTQLALPENEHLQVR